MTEDDQKPAADRKPVETMREALKRAGFKEREPTGQGFVIGTGGPVPKNDDVK